MFFKAVLQLMAWWFPSSPSAQTMGETLSCHLEHMWMLPHPHLVQRSSIGLTLLSVHWFLLHYYHIVVSALSETSICHFSHPEASTCLNLGWYLMSNIYNQSSMLQPQSHDHWQPAWISNYWMSLSHMIVICHLFCRLPTSKVNWEAGKVPEIVVMWSPCITTNGDSFNYYNRGLLELLLLRGMVM